MGKGRERQWVFWSMALIILFGVTSCAKKDLISEPEEIVVEDEAIESADIDSEGAFGEEGVDIIDSGKAIVLEDAFFAFDRHNLDSGARTVLKKNRELLKAAPNAEILVEGHCDERGTVEYNLALGQKRAEAAKDYMISLGMSASKVSTISYGEELPLDTRSSEEAWAKNRRAHIVIIKR